MRKILSLILSLSLLFQQVSFAQVAAELNIAGYFSKLNANSVKDKFRPLELRYFSYDPSNDSFKVLLDKGDVKDLSESKVQIATKTLLSYFLVGVSLPDSMFWVNLRPDAIDQIIDPYLEKTDVGRIMLETDLQLKKDIASFTSPQTAEGKEYWTKLYKKAAELYGNQNVTIPTLTRPWIVPGEIIVRESKGSAYVYKANLKVMLEQDYLKKSATYNFKDERSRALNEYSSQLIRDLIIPRLTKEVNSSKRYALLRQVYYSLILSRWFKLRFHGKAGIYSSLINTKDISNLTSKESWSKETYFKQYQKSFAQGEYNSQEPVYTHGGQVIRSYFSGGVNFEQISLAGFMFPFDKVSTGTFETQSNTNPDDLIFKQTPILTLIEATQIMRNNIYNKDAAVRYAIKIIAEQGDINLKQETVDKLVELAKKEVEIFWEHGSDLDDGRVEEAREEEKANATFANEMLQIIGSDNALKAIQIISPNTANSPTSVYKESSKNLSEIPNNLAEAIQIIRNNIYNKDVKVREAIKIIANQKDDGLLQQETIDQLVKLAQVKIEADYEHFYQLEDGRVEDTIEKEEQNAAFATEMLQIIGTDRALKARKIVDNIFHQETVGRIPNNLGEAIREIRSIYNYNPTRAAINIIAKQGDANLKQETIAKLVEFANEYVRPDYEHLNQDTDPYAEAAEEQEARVLFAIEMLQTIGTNAALEALQSIRSNLILTADQDVSQVISKVRAKKALDRNPSDKEFEIIWQAHLTQAEGEKGDLGQPDKDGIYRNSTLSLETRAKKIKVLKASGLFNDDQIKKLGDYGAMGTSGLEVDRLPVEYAGYQDKKSWTTVGDLFNEEDKRRISQWIEISGQNIGSIEIIASWQEYDRGTHDADVVNDYTYSGKISIFLKDIKGISILEIGNCYTDTLVSPEYSVEPRHFENSIFVPRAYFSSYVPGKAKRSNFKNKLLSNPPDGFVYTIATKADVIKAEMEWIKGTPGVDIEQYEKVVKSLFRDDKTQEEVISDILMLRNKYNQQKFKQDEDKVISQARRINNRAVEIFDNLKLQNKRDLFIALILAEKIAQNTSSLDMEKWIQYMKVNSKIDDSGIFIKALKEANEYVHVVGRNAGLAGDMEFLRFIIEDWKKNNKLNKGSAKIIIVAKKDRIAQDATIDDVKELLRIPRYALINDALEQGLVEIIDSGSKISGTNLLTATPEFTKIINRVNNGQAVLGVKGEENNFTVNGINAPHFRLFLAGSRDTQVMTGLQWIEDSLIYDAQVPPTAYPIIIQVPAGIEPAKDYFGIRQTQMEMKAFWEARIILDAEKADWKQVRQALRGGVYQTIVEYVVDQYPDKAWRLLFDIYPGKLQPNEISRHYQAFLLNKKVKEQEFSFFEFCKWLNKELKEKVLGSVVKNGLGGVYDVQAYKQINYDPADPDKPVAQFAKRSDNLQGKAVDFDTRQLVLRSTLVELNNYDQVSGGLDIDIVEAEDVQPDRNLALFYPDKVLGVNGLKHGRTLLISHTGGYFFPPALKTNGIDKNAPSDFQRVSKLNGIIDMRVRNGKISMFPVYNKAVLIVYKDGKIEFRRLPLEGGSIKFIPNYKIDWSKNDVNSGSLENDVVVFTPMNQKEVDTHDDILSPRQDRGEAYSLFKTKYKVGQGRFNIVFTGGKEANIYYNSVYLQPEGIIVSLTKNEFTKRFGKLLTAKIMNENNTINSDQEVASYPLAIESMEMNIPEDVDVSNIKYLSGGLTLAWKSNKLPGELADRISDELLKSIVNGVPLSQDKYKIEMGKIEKKVRGNFRVEGWYNDISRVTQETQLQQITVRGPRFYWVKTNNYLMIVAAEGREDTAMGLSFPEAVYMAYQKLFDLLEKKNGQDAKRTKIEFNQEIKSLEILNFDGGSSVGLGSFVGLNENSLPIAKHVAVMDRCSGPANGKAGERPVPMSIVHSAKGDKLSKLFDQPVTLNDIWRDWEINDSSHKNSDVLIEMIREKINYRNSAVREAIKIIAKTGSADLKQQAVDELTIFAKKPVEVFWEHGSDLDDGRVEEAKEEEKANALFAIEMLKIINTSNALKVIDVLKLNLIPVEELLRAVSKATSKERAQKALGRHPNDKELEAIWQAHFTQAEGEKGDIGKPDKDGIYRNSTLSLETKAKKIKVLKASGLFSDDQIKKLGDYGAIGISKIPKDTNNAGNMNIEKYKEYANSIVKIVMNSEKDKTFSINSSLEKCLDMLSKVMDSDDGSYSYAFSELVELIIRFTDLRNTNPSLAQKFALMEEKFLLKATEYYHAKTAEYLHKSLDYMLGNFDDVKNSIQKFLQNNNLIDGYEIYSIEDWKTTGGHDSSEYWYSVIYKNGGFYSVAEWRLPDSSSGTTRYTGITQAGESKLVELFRVSNLFTGESSDLLYKLEHSDLKDVNSGSNSSVKSETTGGIDFRTMLLNVQTMGSFKNLNFKMLQLSQDQLSKINISAEIQQIKNMLKSGIVPSSQRVKELVGVCIQKKELSSQSGDLLLCLGDIFKLEEENASESSPELKEALIIVDSQS
ncbi:MAG: hypothetical protein WC543_02620 [Candidatus Omnitrophota bacterium]